MFDHKPHRYCGKTARFKGNTERLIMLFGKCFFNRKREPCRKYGKRRLTRGKLQRLANIVHSLRRNIGTDRIPAGLLCSRKEGAVSAAYIENPLCTVMKPFKKRLFLAPVENLCINGIDNRHPA